MRTVLILGAAALLVAGCAHRAPPQDRLLPVTLQPPGGGWTVRVTADRLLADLPEARIERVQPDVLSADRTSVLANTAAGDRYISVYVRAEPCEAEGRTWPLTVAVGVAPASDPEAWTFSYQGCAERVGS
jgi:hypothetical protein